MPTTDPTNKVMLISSNPAAESYVIFVDKQVVFKDFPELENSNILKNASNCLLLRRENYLEHRLITVVKYGVESAPFFPVSKEKNSFEDLLGCYHQNNKIQTVIDAIYTAHLRNILKPATPAALAAFKARANVLAGFGQVSSNPTFAGKRLFLAIDNFVEYHYQNFPKLVSDLQLILESVAGFFPDLKRMVNMDLFISHSHLFIGQLPDGQTTVIFLPLWRDCFPDQWPFVTVIGQAPPRSRYPGEIFPQPDKSAKSKKREASKLEIPFHTITFVTEIPNMDNLICVTAGMNTLDQNGTVNQLHHFIEQSGFGDEHILIGRLHKWSYLEHNAGKKSNGDHVANAAIPTVMVFASETYPGKTQLQQFLGIPQASNKKTTSAKPLLDKDFVRYVEIAPHRNVQFARNFVSLHNVAFAPILGGFSGIKICNIAATHYHHAWELPTMCPDWLLSNHVVDIMVAPDYDIDRNVNKYHVAFLCVVAGFPSHPPPPPPHLLSLGLGSQGIGKRVHTELVSLDKSCYPRDLYPKHLLLDASKCNMQSAAPLLSVRDRQKATTEAGQTPLGVHRPPPPVPAASGPAVFMCHSGGPVPASNYDLQFPTVQSPQRSLRSSMTAHPSNGANVLTTNYFSVLSGQSLTAQPGPPPDQVKVASSKRLPLYKHNRPVSLSSCASPPSEPSSYLAAMGMTAAEHHNAVAGSSQPHALDVVQVDTPDDDDDDLEYAPTYKYNPTPADILVPNHARQAVQVLGDPDPRQSWSIDDNANQRAADAAAALAVLSPQALTNLLATLNLTSRTEDSTFRQRDSSNSARLQVPPAPMVTVPNTQVSVTRFNPGLSDNPVPNPHRSVQLHSADMSVSSDVSPATGPSITTISRLRREHRQAYGIPDSPQVLRRVRALSQSVKPSRRLRPVPSAKRTKKVVRSVPSVKRSSQGQRSVVPVPLRAVRNALVPVPTQSNSAGADNMSILTASSVRRASERSSHADSVLSSRSSIRLRGRHVKPAVKLALMSRSTSMVKHISGHTSGEMVTPKRTRGDSASSSSAEPPPTNPDV